MLGIIKNINSAPGPVNFSCALTADVTTSSPPQSSGCALPSLSQSIQSLFAEIKKALQKSTSEVFKLHSFKQMKSYIPVVLLFPIATYM